MEENDHADLHAGIKTEYKEIVRPALSGKLFPRSSKDREYSPSFCNQTDHITET